MAWFSTIWTSTVENTKNTYRLPIVAVWPDWAKYHHIGNFWRFFTNIWQNCEPTLVNFLMPLGKYSSLQRGKNWKNNLSFDHTVLCVGRYRSLVRDFESHFPQNPFTSLKLTLSSYFFYFLVTRTNDRTVSVKRSLSRTWADARGKINLMKYFFRRKNDVGTKWI